MRSARMLLATGAAAAVLALGAPGAHASGGDGNHGDSSYSGQDSSSGRGDSSYGKEHDKDGSHDGPHGGMHTGGGALSAVKQDGGGAHDPRFDPETYKDKDSWGGGSDPWGGGQGKPHGGMHTGGGALANQGVTAGGLAVVALAGTGLYMARRKKTAAGLA